MSSKQREALEKILAIAKDEFEDIYNAGRIEDLCREALAEPPEPIGNNAKTREALMQIRDSFYIDPDDNKCHSDIDASDLREICDVALSAPPKNCNLYDTKDEAREAFQKLRGHRVLADVSLWDDPDEIEEMFDWLFAEGEGDNNANK